MQKNAVNKFSYLGVIGLAFIGIALTRLLPHPYNFTPMVTVGLLSVGFGKHRFTALLLALAAWIVSDYGVNMLVQPDYTASFSAYLTSATALGVYTAFLLASLSGLILKSRLNVGRFALASLSGSFVFYLVSNTAIWLGSAFYAKSITGYLACLYAGIPFYHAGDPLSSFALNQFLGDAFYMGIAYVGILVWQNYSPAKAVETN
jgi:hypothetical protein